ncbi:MAG TPA: hypothetical protein VF996_00885 [Candidatus Saccharimonadales bacterium]
MLTRVITYYLDELSIDVLEVPCAEYFGVQNCHVLAFLGGLKTAVSRVSVVGADDGFAAASLKRTVGLPQEQFLRCFDDEVLAVIHPVGADVGGVEGGFVAVALCFRAVAVIVGDHALGGFGLDSFDVGADVDIVSRTPGNHGTSDAGDEQDQ